MSPTISPNSAGRTNPPSIDATLRAQFTSLRNEISIRIIFQNVLLCLTWCSLGLILASAVICNRPELLLVHSVLGVSAAAMWAHHGARTAQIRSYLTSTVEPALYRQSHVQSEGQPEPSREPSSVHGWEFTLARMQFRSVLGSRWFVSTKGFFLASQLVIVVLLIARDPFVWLVPVSLCALGGTIWVLHDPPLDTIEKQTPAE